ncbi:exopolysaccharide biosynthesis protein [Amycolatopsis sp. NPDC059021]|uniref:exopolysaccharide biosynthesis protein n=1 Tax=Amycolatopsis sp. NPDC059021 TaxID=3346704 RepID=UPI0036728A43
MRDDTVRLSMVGQVLRRRWRLLAVLVVVGGLAGAGASLLFSPGYKTSASVLMQGPRQADELLTQAQVATSSVVLDRSAANLGWHVSSDDLRKRITASAAQGNVVTLEVSGATADEAKQLADQVADQFVKYSTQLLANSMDPAGQLAREQRETLRQQVVQTNQKISDLQRSVEGKDLTVESVQARTQLEGLRTSLEQAINNLNQADAATGQGNMVVMGPAARPSAAAAPTMVQFVAGGAVLFFLVGVLGHLFAARADRRLRSETEIAAALGAPVLSAIDVPDAAAPAAATGLAGKLRRAVGGDRPWHVPRLEIPADDLNRDVRYRRVLTRLGLTHGTRERILVLTADDDGPAAGAAEQLGVAADAEAVPRSAMERAEIAASRPIVPDGGGVTGVLVVLGAGSRTAWELVGIAEACADAGHEIFGALLVHPVRPGVAPSKSQDTTRRDAMAGSA